MRILNKYGVGYLCGLYLVGYCFLCYNAGMLGKVPPKLGVPPKRRKESERRKASHNRSAKKSKEKVYGEVCGGQGQNDPGAAKRCPSPRRGAGREHHSLYQPGYRRSYGAGQRRTWIRWEGMRYALHGALTCWMRAVGPVPCIDTPARGCGGSGKKGIGVFSHPLSYNKTALNSSHSA